MWWREGGGVRCVVCGEGCMVVEFEGRIEVGLQRIVDVG